MDAGSDLVMYTLCSATDPGDAQTQMDFTFKTDHRAVLAVLSLKAKMGYSAKHGVNLRGWKPDDSWHKAAAETLTDWKTWDVMAPLLWETAKTQNDGNQGDDCDRA